MQTNIYLDNFTFVTKLTIVIFFNFLLYKKKEKNQVYLLDIKKVYHVVIAQQFFVTLSFVIKIL